jgi:hypothetical protein
MIAYMIINKGNSIYPTLEVLEVDARKKDIVAGSATGAFISVKGKKCNFTKSPKWWGDNGKIEDYNYGIKLPTGSVALFNKLLYATIEDAEKAIKKEYADLHAWINFYGNSGYNWRV